MNIDQRLVENIIVKMMKELSNLLDQQAILIFLLLGIISLFLSILHELLFSEENAEEKVWIGFLLLIPVFISLGFVIGKIWALKELLK